jgi:hypothetical protein
MLKMYDFVQINIVNKAKTNVNKHYNDYDNQVGIIRQIDTTLDIRYLLYYEDDKFRDIDRKNGGIYIHKEDLVKLEKSNDDLILKMQKQFDEEKYARKYAWGKCEKCGAAMKKSFKSGKLYCSDKCWLN